MMVNSEIAMDCNDDQILFFFKKKEFSSKSILGYNFFSLLILSIFFNYIFEPEKFPGVKFVKISWIIIGGEFMKIEEFIDSIDETAQREGFNNEFLILVADKKGRLTQWTHVWNENIRRNRFINKIKKRLCKNSFVKTIY